MSDDAETLRPETIAALLARGAEKAFPPATDAPANRVGSTPQQDFYFRALLRELVERTARSGVPALEA